MIDEDMKISKNISLKKPHRLIKYIIINKE